MILRLSAIDCVRNTEKILLSRLQILNKLCIDDSYTIHPLDKKVGRRCHPSIFILLFFFVLQTVIFINLVAGCFANFFHGHFCTFLALPRPLHSPSRPRIFHGPKNFSTATFEQRGRGDGHLATLTIASPPFFRGFT
jgi:hypothetical protein